MPIRLCIEQSSNKTLIIYLFIKQSQTDTLEQTLIVSTYLPTKTIVSPLMQRQRDQQVVPIRSRRCHTVVPCLTGSHLTLHQMSWFSTLSDNNLEISYNYKIMYIRLRYKIISKVLHFCTLS